MPLRSIRFAIAVLMVTQLAAAAQGPEGFGAQQQGLFGGPGAPQEPPPKVESVMLPAEKFDDIPLNDVLTFIHEKLPEFNSVVVRSPGVQDKYPIIPSMSAKNVTIGQFLEFLKVSFPGVDIQRINGPAGPLYVVKITAGPMDQPNFPFGPGGFGGGVPGPQPDLHQSVVQVYKLTDIVASLADNKEGAPHEVTRASLADILSLAQSALEESGEKEAVVLKVHEQTQTLLFKGSMFKQAVLEQVLNTLRPSQDPIQTQQVNELKDKVRMLEAQREIDQVRGDESKRSRDKDIEEMRVRLRESQKVLEEMQMENTLLKTQLEQARKSAK